MLAPPPPPEEGIGTLFSRLIDDGRELVRSEINLYRELTLNRVVRSRTAVILAVAGVMLAQASVTALIIGLLFGLAWWFGPIGAGVAVAAVGLLISALLLRAAVKRFVAVSELDGDKDKRP